MDDTCKPFIYISRITYDSTTNEYNGIDIYAPDPSQIETFKRNLVSFCFPFQNSIPEFFGHCSNFMFSFGFTDSEKNLTFVFVSLNRNCTVAYSVVSEYYHPSLLFELVQKVSDLYEKDTEKCMDIIHNLANAKLERKKFDWYIDTLKNRLQLSNTSLMSPQNEIGKLYNFIFSKFSPYYILSLIIATLFEYKIVFMAIDQTMLGECCFSTLGLIYPMQWTSAFIPLLSQNVSQALEAPFPFMIGIPSTLASLVADNTIDRYFVLNPDTHSGTLVGDDAFDPIICDLIDKTAVEMNEMLESYQHILPVSKLQVAIRKFIINTLKTVYDVESDDPYVIYEKFKKANVNADGSLAYKLSQTQFMQAFFSQVFEEHKKILQQAFWPGETFKNN